jgi:tetratricopeptide (TPR) repeat protein
MSLPKIPDIALSLTLILSLVGCYANFSRRAEIYEEKGDYRSSMLSYQKAAESSNPDKRAQALGELGRLYIQFGTDGAYRKAEKLLREAKSLLSPDDPQFAEVSFHLGYCYYKLDDSWINRAISNFEAALRSDANHQRSHFYLGTLYYQAGVYEPALEHLNRVTDTDNAAAAKHIAALTHKQLAIRTFATRNLKNFDLAMEICGDAINDVEVAIKNESDPAKKQLYRETREGIQHYIDFMIDQLPKIAELKIEPVLGALYKSYDQIPIGTVTLINPTREPLQNPKLIVKVPRFIDVPTVMEIDQLPPNRGEAIVDLTVQFNAQIFNVRETIENHPISITLQYSTPTGTNKDEDLESTFQIYSRNTTFWKPVESIAAFISPKNAAVRAITEEYVDADFPIEKAIQIYDALALYGIQYLQDPTDPYGKGVDTVYYPWETLKSKRGDCDDLSVLYASILENAGIDTALLLPPGHIYVMFNSEIPVEQAKRLFPDESLYIDVNGFAWIPVEVTMLGETDEPGEHRTFFDAWRYGAEVYRNQEDMPWISTKEAWETYKPASDGFNVINKASLPNKNKVERMFNADLRKAKDHWNAILHQRITEYQTPSPELSEATRHNRLGITYALQERLPEAEAQFRHALEKASEAPPSEVAKYHNNLANVLLLRSLTGEARANKQLKTTLADKAFQLYKNALTSDSRNARVHFNRAEYHYALRQGIKGDDAYNHAIALAKASNPPLLGLGQSSPDSDSLDTRSEGISHNRELRWRLYWLE